MKKTARQPEPEKLIIELGGLADSMAQQLRAQNIRIPGHATASLERTRKAIWQLVATNVLTEHMRLQAEKRFLMVIVKTIERYKRDADIQRIDILTPRGKLRASI